LISFRPVLNRENDFDGVMKNLKENNFACFDLSHNELAKAHVRHLAGGRSAVPDERLFRFDFPESPGALQRFLQALDMDWNVSLFHYRNHGDDFGRVLCGIQVQENCDKNLRNFLENLGYSYTEETNNPAYTTFLKANGNGKHAH